MKHYFFPTLAGMEALTQGEADAPRPGHGQVLVRMHAASINFRDLLVARGGYRGALEKDLVPLSDGAGEIVEVGDEVTRWKKGDRVTGTFYPSWLGGAMTPGDAANALGGQLQGTLTEYRLFAESSVVRMPEHLSYNEAATLPCAAVTAWNALFGAKPLEPGQSVLLLGTGGVSTFALQFAQAAGARTLVISSSDAKLEKARVLGATDGVNYRTHPDWHNEVRRLTNGRGVDHVVEVGGPGTLERSLGAVRFGGWIHLIGVLTTGQISLLSILGNTGTVRGVLVGSRSMFDRMNEMITVAKLYPSIARVFPFKDALSAYHELASANHVGKIVIQIDW